jgi:hypothetical protein
MLAMTIRNWAMLCAALALGCPKSTPEPAPGSGTKPAPEPAETTAATSPAPAPSPTPAPAPSPAPAEPKQTWLGVWNSVSCGQRKYVREVTFAEEGKVTGRDLISPCPKNVDCVWSGIVDWKGTYEVKGDTIALDVAISVGPKGKLTLPTELGWDESKALVVEDPGGAACAYARGAAAQPGAK